MHDLSQTDIAKPLTSNKRHALTPLQLILYHHSKTYPKDPAYNLIYSYKITGDLDAERLKNILQITYNSIDIFKVTFYSANEKIFQYCDYNKNYPVTIIKRSAHESENIFRKMVYEKINELENTAINIEQWPLANFLFYTCNQHEHYIILSIPHIIADGHSFHMLFDTINGAYNQELSGAELTEFIEHSFAPHSSNENYVHIEAINNDVVTEILPADQIDLTDMNKIRQSRNSKGMLEGNTCIFDLEKEKINIYTARHAITKAVFFLAIHALFLKKILDAYTVIIGVPVANRNTANTKIFGCFITTQPLVIDFKEIHAFQQLLIYIKNKIEVLKNSPNLIDVNVSFTTLFTYYYKAFTLNLAKCTIEKIQLNKSHAMSELKIAIESLDSCYQILIESGNYFKDCKLEPIFKHLVQYVLEKHDCNIKDITVISNNELAKYYGHLNKNTIYVKKGFNTIISAFEDVVKLHPDQIALSNLREEWTYSTLNKTTNKIARFLSKKILSIAYIVVCIKRDPYLVATMLAILKLGKIYIPLDPASPKERMKYILNDLAPAVVIGESYIQEAHLLESANFIGIEDVIHNIENQENGNLGLEFDNIKTAYIIYTSGTTGKPKGVEISDRNLLNLIHACDERFEFNCRDVWTFFHSAAFDFSIWEIFGCLLHGAKLIIIEREIAKSPSHFYNILADQQVTVLNQTPTAFKNLIHEDSEKKAQLSLRYVIFGGEALLFPSLTPWVKNHPLSKTKLINMYGITETTIHTTFYEILEKDLESHQSIIGKPLDHLGITLVNSDNNILPYGIPGQILISGQSVSKGYYNKPELTLQKFFKNNDSAQAVYMSGDLAMIDPNGDLVYLGRIDNQVQLRGFRIELNEIKSCFINSQFIIDCAIELVDLSPDHNNPRLIAFIVPANDFCEQRLKTYLSAHLPDYMIPSNFILVDKIVITINGKTDVPAMSAYLEKTNPIENIGESPTEKFLVELISNISNNIVVDTNDNIFNLGITSIDLIDLTNIIKNKYPTIKISVLDFFEYHSIEKLAKYIDENSQ